MVKVVDTYPLSRLDFESITSPYQDGGLSNIQVHNWGKKPETEKNGFIHLYTEFSLYFSYLFLWCWNHIHLYTMSSIFQTKYIAIKIHKIDFRRKLVDELIKYTYTSKYFFPI